METATKTLSANSSPPFGSEQAPGLTRASWQEACLADHFVQFYHDERVLLDAVGGFIATGLRSVEGGIVIATTAHRLAIEARLEARGIDLAAARARRQYVPLDATETIARLVADGQPNEALFNQMLGGVVARMLSAGFRARIFAEMFALLWAAGHQAAALRLEQFWNSLGRTQRFALFCAYPMAPFADGADAAGYRHICAAHQGVIPAALTEAGPGPAVSAR